MCFSSGWVLARVSVQSHHGLVRLFIYSFNKRLLDAVCSVPSPVEGLKCAETTRSCHALGSPQPRPD